MTTIKVNKQLVLDNLSKNLELHEKSFAEAKDNYLKKVEDFLLEKIDKIKKEGKVEKEDRCIRLPVEPVNYSKEYKKAIRFVEASISSQLDLSRDDFAAYIEDDWSWSYSWSISNSLYSEYAGSKLADYGEDDSR